MLGTADGPGVILVGLVAWRRPHPLRNWWFAMGYSGVASINVGCFALRHSTYSSVTGTQPCLICPSRLRCQAQGRGAAEGIFIIPVWTGTSEVGPLYRDRFREKFSSGHQNSSPSPSPHHRPQDKLRSRPRPFHSL